MFKKLLILLTLCLPLAPSRALAADAIREHGQTTEIAENHGEEQMPLLPDPSSKATWIEASGR